MYISTFKLMMTFTRSGTFRSRPIVRNRHEIIVRARFRRRTQNTLALHLISRYLGRHDNSTLPLMYLTRTSNRRLNILTIVPRTNMTTSGHLFRLSRRVRRVHTNQYIRLLSRRIHVPYTRTRRFTFRLYSKTGHGVAACNDSIGGRQAAARFAPCQRQRNQTHTSTSSTLQHPSNTNAAIQPTCQSCN